MSEDRVRRDVCRAWKSLVFEFGRGYFWQVERDGCMCADCRGIDQAACQAAAEGRG